MNTQEWITLWGWVYLIGLTSFFILVIAIIPLGARDLAALFKHLNREVDTIHDPAPEDDDSTANPR